MTDQKASIKIDFDFHGKHYRFDGYINYFDNGDGIDDRVVEFFRESYEDGMSRYHRKTSKYFKEQEEKLERETLQLLKDKYES